MKNKITLINDNSGMVFIASVLLLGVLVILGTTGYLMTTGEHYIARNYQTSKMALYNAEAGYHYARTEIEAALRASPATYTLPALGTSNFLTYAASPPSSFNNLFELGGTNQIKITAHATEGNRYELTSTGYSHASTTAFSRAQEEVTVTFERITKGINFAAFGDKKLEEKNGGDVWSYDSREGQDPSDPSWNDNMSTSEGDVGSNENITLKNKADIDGDVVKGQDSGTDAGYYPSGNPGPTVTGDVETIGEEIDIDPLEEMDQFIVDAYGENFIDDASTDSNVISTINADPVPAAGITLTSGNDYYFDNILLKNPSGDFTIDASTGPITIYINDSLTLNNGKNLIINTGGGAYDVKIYFSGTLDAKNGSEIISDSTSVQFISDTTDTINLHNSSVFRGLIYTPNAKLEIKNSAAILGALWGSEVTIHNSADVYYDEALGDLKPTNNISFLSWRNGRF